MPVLYDLHWTKPRALVERRLRLEVIEKLRPDGSVAIPLDATSVTAAIAMLPPRSRAERRDLPAAFLRQSGARTRGGRCGARGAARCGGFGQPRDPAGDQGISAHQHHRDQRLCAAGGARLRHVARRSAARAWHRSAAAVDAVERRARVSRVRRDRAGAHHRKRPGRGCCRRRGTGAAARRAAGHHVRHGRHHGEGRPGREWRGAAQRGARGRRRRDGRIALAGRRRLSAEAAGDRSGRGGCRRRIDLPARCGWCAEGRAGQRGRRTGTGLLRTRRHRTDDHRLQPGAGLSRSGGAGRRRAETRCRMRRARRSRGRWRSRCIDRWRKRRKACCVSHRRR